MKLPGIVTNITAFGAFVDIGVHQNGLVHISELADRFVKTPADVVKLQQKVTVTLMEIDVQRKRIALSMKNSLTGPKEEREKLTGKDKSKKQAKPVKKDKTKKVNSKKEQSRFSNNPFCEVLSEMKTNK